MKYCLVGIKGVAMSGLAKILLMDEHIVEGIDVNDDYYTIKNLKGIKLYDFKNYELNRDFTYIIGNSFQNHKIVSEIQKSQYSFEFYPKFVSKYFEKYDMIAISGTHGKTMSCSIFKTVFPNVNYLIGDGTSNLTNSNYFLIEACEYKDTFLKYKPSIGLVLNIDYDHPDYFKSFDDYYLSFIKFMNNCNICVINGDDVAYRNKHIITFGMKKDNDFVFKYAKGKVIINDNTFVLPFIGINYAYNFVGVYVLLKMIGVKDEVIRSNICDFVFPIRRNERFLHENCLIINDYAHHPTEIKNIYCSLKEEYKNTNIVCIFEPHTITRLDKFKEEFKEVLSLFDDCYLYPLFSSAREKYNSKQVDELYSFLGYKIYDENIIDELINENIVICFLGAGVINVEFNKIKNRFI